MTNNVINPTVRFGMGLLVFLGLFIGGCGGGGYGGGGYGSATPTTSTYSISGTIIGGATDNSAVTISLTGGTATAPITTMAGGSYSFTGLANGTYTVTPTRAAYTFTPASAQITIYGGNMTTNFTEAP